jgi:acyl-CoA synthetase (AMP-forming)/AMP-acid ligase II
MKLDLASVWERIADIFPDADAVVMGATRVSWKEFDDRAARFAGTLEARGVRPGSKVGLYLFNSPEYLIAHYGAFKHGCVPVNVNYRYLDEELRYLIENSDSEAVVFHTSLAPRVAAVQGKLPAVKVWFSVDDGGTRPEFAIDFTEALEQAGPQPRRERPDPAHYMLYTGGTTGMPKGVLYDQHDFVAGLYQQFAVVDWGVPIPDSLEQVEPFVRVVHERTRLVSVPCCPLMHGTGMWVGAMPAHLTGGTVVLLEGRSFDADELITVIAREGVTRVVIVGDAFARPFLRAMEAAEAAGRLPDLSSVGQVISSGAMWSAEIKDGMRRFLPNATLIDALGSTEGGGYATQVAGSDSSGRTARFVPAPDTLLVDESGVPLDPGAPGPGLLASRTAARGYYKDDEKTARTFTEIDGRWYVITGDWASREPDGTIVLHGRGSNCINTGGEKVYPEEVEEALKRHPEVEDCLVVGVPDERFGERVVAVVERRPGTDPSGEELRDFLRSELSGYKIPKQLVVVDAVRRAPNGKADYGWAKDIVLGASSAVR